MSLTPKFPSNITSLSSMVADSLAPQVRMCQRVLYYSQSVIGDYKYCARTEDHLGWMICDGRLVDRTEYGALFDIIGTSFGSTTASNFQLPDFRGKVFGSLNLASNPTNTYSQRNLGTTVGEETHTLVISEMPSHNHTITDPSHNHGITDPGHIHTGDKYNGGTQDTDNAFGTETAADTGVDTGSVNSSTTGITVNNATTGITINNRGGDQPHNNMQPTLFGGNVYIFAGLPGDPPGSL